MSRKENSAALSAIAESLPTAIYTVISPYIIASSPLAAPLAIAAAMYGAALVYKQNDFKKQIQVLLDNPSIFTEELISSKEFSDGLVVHFDSYLKMRGDKKLQMARNIFFDFALSNSKPVYPLERYDDTLLKISDAGIRFLGFVESRVPKIKEEYMLDEAKRVGAIMTTEHKIAEFKKGHVDNKPLSYFIGVIYAREVAKGRIDNYKESDKPWMAKIIDDVNTEINLIVSELVQLGIADKGITPSTGGWSPSGGEFYYNLTHYGEMFTSAIKPDAEYELIKNENRRVAL